MCQIKILLFHLKNTLIVNISKYLRETSFKWKINKMAYLRKNIYIYISLTKRNSTKYVPLNWTSFNMYSFVLTIIVVSFNQIKYNKTPKLIPKWAVFLNKNNCTDQKKYFKNFMSQLILCELHAGFRLENFFRKLLKFIKLEILSRLLGRFAPIFYFICKHFFFENLQNFQKSNIDGGKFVKIWSSINLPWGHARSRSVQ